MTTYHYDFFVIGAGSGGVRASRIAAQLGAKVGVAEDSDMGGTCVNLGCIPKKLFVYASEFSHAMEVAKGYGIENQTQFTWQTLLQNKNKEIKRLNGIYDKILSNVDVAIHRGRAEFISPTQVQVGDDIIEAKNFLIAVGGWPTKVPFEGSDLAITSNEAFHLQDLPKRAVVLGGGYIAVEFAGIFNGLGVDTKLAYRRNPILRGFDMEVRKFVQEQVRQSGVDIINNASPKSIHKTENGLLLTYEDGRNTETDLVLCATGRAPKTKGLGLEKADVEISSNGAVIVNDQFQSSQSHIYAVGDVIDRVALTPVALAEGMYVANHLFGKNPRPVDYQSIATAVFCQPNIATVGLTEEQAREQESAIDVYVSTFRPLKLTMTDLQEKMLMKLIVRSSDQKILGAHMVGHEAGEIIQGISIAMNAGATKEDFDRTIGIHPTAAEEFVTMRQVTRN